MGKSAVGSASYGRLSAVFLLAIAGMSAAVAQPADNSPNQFGDRQSGQWGDPGLGHFGNPAAGDFDKSQIRPPPPGARPLGKVYSGKPPEGSPYISLPAPTDAAPASTAAPAAAENKKPAKKRASKKKQVSE